MMHEVLYCVFDYIIVRYTLPPGLKLGRVIRVTRVNRFTFCPGQVGTSDLFYKISGSDPDSVLYYMR